MSARTDRASLLLQQSRFEPAAKELRLALADDPDDPLAHALLAQCLARLGQLAEATEEAGRAVACGPDLPFTHYSLATVRYDRNHYPEAEAAVAEAIRLDPTHPSYHSLLAAVRGEQEDWAGALAAAERGLEQDPEHRGCGNLRAMALVKLGRRGEAGAALEYALARDPDDAFTHANRGWALLHEGDHRRAREHFREALRLDPNLEYARAGMVEALKAGNWFYRQVLGYFLWMSRLSPQARWGIVIGLFVLQRVVASVARSDPGLRPVLEPVLIAYVAFVLTTWTAVPLSNLLLRLSRFGRYALSAEERRASNWVAGFVALALAGVGWGLFAPKGYAAWLGWEAALGYMILLVPLSGTLACEPGWPRRVMAVCTVGMFGLVTTAVGLFATGVYLDGRDNRSAVECVRGGLALITVTIWAGVGSALLANWLAGVRPRR
jgi:tetratricopeptide (TPR) repeat protein